MVDDEVVLQFVSFCMFSSDAFDDFVEYLDDQVDHGVVHNALVDKVL